MKQPDQTAGKGRRKQLLLEQITAYVDANLTKRLTLKQIAEQFGVSVSTVTQLFQKKSQPTFHGFVTQCRMEKARKLIYQGRTLESVGKEVGYQDHSTFYRAFRQTFGMSPREYRKTITWKLTD
jgi:two-component system response regulator YesN